MSTILTENYNRKFLLKKILPKAQWSSFPAAGDRVVWEKIKKIDHLSNSVSQILEQAQSALGQAWPELRAEDYMAYARTGNRTTYEKAYFLRRKRLSILAIAEALDYSGKYIDEIINGIWAMLSEPAWCLPAHAGMLSPDAPALPYHDREIVDLFASQTAFILGELLSLLRQELNQAAPELEQRIIHEIDRRIISEIEQNDDYPWFQGRNNWSTWCATNVIGAAMHTIEDQHRLVDILFKMMTVLDRFIAKQPDDGTCPEGPMYWNVAAGNLLIALDLLYSRSNGEIDIYDYPKIKKLGQFIEKIHIDNELFLAFGDTLPSMTYPAPIIYHYGKKVMDEQLADFALNLLDYDNIEQSATNVGVTGNLNYILRRFFWLPEQLPPITYHPDLTKWLPELQLLVARELSCQNKGLVLGAIGGHNGMSHAHCDVGQFSVYYAGQPFIIDLGRGEYTRQVFSAERYKTLWVGSGGHNLPIINGYEQLQGPEYGASEVKFSDSANCTSLELDIQQAYPPASDLKKYRRTISLDRRSRTIKIYDKFECLKSDPELLLPLYVACDANIIAPGIIRLNNDAGTTLILEYNHKAVNAAIELVALNDKLLEHNWPQLRRIQLRYLHHGGVGEIKLKIYH